MFAGARTLAGEEQQPAQAAVQNATENAALEYWLAFALMPTRDEPLDSATTDSPKYGFAVPVRKEMAKYFERDGEAALRHLHHGAQLSHCAWGMDLRRDGPTAAAPYADKAHNLARVALLRARWRFEHGQWKEGIDDVIATMMLGRHLGRDKIQYTVNFGCMLEGMSTATAAVYLPQMPASEREVLAKWLERLPPFTPMRDVFLYYENAIDWAIGNFRQAENENRLGPLIDSLRVPEAASTVLKAKSAKQLSEIAELARPLLLAAADALRLPPTEYERLYKERFAPRLKANPLAVALGPYYEIARVEECVAACRLAMLKAGIDVLNRGRPAVADHPDPYGEGPFELVNFPGGFELKSRLVFGEYHSQMDFGLRRMPAKAK